MEIVQDDVTTTVANNGLSPENPVYSLDLVNSIIAGNPDIDTVHVMADYHVETALTLDYGRTVTFREYEHTTPNGDYTGVIFDIEQDTGLAMTGINIADPKQPGELVKLSQNSRLMLTNSQLGAGAMVYLMDPKTYTYPITCDSTSTFTVNFVDTSAEKDMGTNGDMNKVGICRGNHVSQIQLHVSFDEGKTTYRDNGNWQLQAIDGNTYAVWEPPYHAVYVDGVDGDDTNTGKSRTTAVRTFAKAKEMLAQVYAEDNTVDTIYVVNTVPLTAADADSDGVVRLESPYKVERMFEETTKGSNKAIYNSSYMFSVAEDLTLSFEITEKVVSEAPTLLHTGGNLVLDGMHIYSNLFDSSRQTYAVVSDGGTLTIKNSEIQGSAALKTTNIQTDIISSKLSGNSMSDLTNTSQYTKKIFGGNGVQFNYGVLYASGQTIVNIDADSEIYLAQKDENNETTFGYRSRFIYENSLAVPTKINMIPAISAAGNAVVNVNSTKLAQYNSKGQDVKFYINKYGDSGSSVKLGTAVGERTCIEAAENSQINLNNLPVPVLSMQLWDSASVTPSGTTEVFVGYVNSGTAKLTLDGAKINAVMLAGKDSTVYTDGTCPIEDRVILFGQDSFVTVTGMLQSDILCDFVNDNINNSWDAQQNFRMTKNSVYPGYILAKPAGHMTDISGLDPAYAQEDCTHIVKINPNSRAIVAGKDVNVVVMPAGVFVDTHNGSDLNDGLTIDKPVKTFAKAGQVAQSNQDWPSDNTRLIYIVDENNAAVISGNDSLVMPANGVKYIVQGLNEKDVGNLITVPEGASFTAENVRFDGYRENNTMAFYAYKIFNVGGTLNLKDCDAIRATEAIVETSGKNACVNIENAKITSPYRTMYYARDVKPKSWNNEVSDSMIIPKYGVNLDAGGTAILKNVDLGFTEYPVDEEFHIGTTTNNNGYGFLYTGLYIGSEAVATCENLKVSGVKASANGHGDCGMAGIYDAGVLNLKGADIENNTGWHGGIWVDDGELNIDPDPDYPVIIKKNSTYEYVLQWNSEKKFGGGIYYKGHKGQNYVLPANVQILQNDGKKRGGGILFDVPGGTLETAATITGNSTTDCDYTNNKYAQGAAIYIAPGSTVKLVEGTVIKDNKLSPLDRAQGHIFISENAVLIQDAGKIEGTVYQYGEYHMNASNPEVTVTKGIYMRNSDNPLVLYGTDGMQLCEEEGKRIDLHPVSTFLAELIVQGVNEDTTAGTDAIVATFDQFTVHDLESELITPDIWGKEGPDVFWDPAQNYQGKNHDNPNAISDANSGGNPKHAVLTFERAVELLAKKGPEGRIVMCSTFDIPYDADYTYDGFTGNVPGNVAEFNVRLIRGLDGYGTVLTGDMWRGIAKTTDTEARTHDVTIKNVNFLGGYSDPVINDQTKGVTIDIDYSKRLGASISTVSLENVDISNGDSPNKVLTKGVRCIGATLDLTDVTISGCRNYSNAKDNVGYDDGYGAGVYFEEKTIGGTKTGFHMKNVTVKDNVAYSSAAAVFVENSIDPDLTLENVEISGSYCTNYTWRINGIDVVGFNASAMYIANTPSDDNYAKGYVRFVNNEVSGNSYSTSALLITGYANITGVFEFEGNEVGLAVTGASDDVRIHDVTFTKNKKAGCYIANFTGTADVRNCTFTNNGDKNNNAYGLVMHAASTSGTVICEDCSFNENWNGVYIGRNDKYDVSQNAGPVILRNSAINSSKNYGVYVYDYTVNDKEVSIENCTITNTGKTDTIYGYGAGIYINSAGNLKVKNCDITGSTKYGIENNKDYSILNLRIEDCNVSRNTNAGIYINACPATMLVTDTKISENGCCGVYLANIKGRGTEEFSNCEITGNGTNTSNAESGIYIKDSIDYTQHVYVHDCLIDGNFGKRAGGIKIEKVRQGKIDIENCQISNNIHRSGFTGAGGVKIEVDINATMGYVKLTSCEISGNETDSSGGGINVDGHTNSKNVYITGCTISGNKAKVGAGVFLQTGSYAMINGGTVIIKNFARENGGGVYVGTNATPVITGETKIFGNRAQLGGGIYLNGGRVNIQKATISGNVSTNDTQGGMYPEGLSNGIFSQGTLLMAGSSVTIPDNIYISSRAYPVRLTNSMRQGSSYNVSFNNASRGGMVYGDPVVGPNLKGFPDNATPYLMYVNPVQPGYVYGKGSLVRGSGKQDAIVIYKCIFVDGQTGSDDLSTGNRGENPDHAFKTVPAAIASAGDMENVVIFISGQVDVTENETWTGQTPVEIRRYTGFKIGGKLAYLAYSGDMVSVKDGGSLTIGSNITGIFGSHAEEDAYKPVGTIFDVEAGSTLTFANSTQIGRNKTGTGGTEGGAIRNAGTVNIPEGVVVTARNSSAQKGGAVYNEGTLNVGGTLAIRSTSAHDGGGIYNEGTVDVTGATNYVGTTATSGKAAYTTGDYILRDGSTISATGDVYLDDGGYITMGAGNETISGGRLNVTIGDPSHGRIYVKYEDENADANAERVRYKLPTSITSTYSLAESTDNGKNLILEMKNVVYVDVNYDAANAEVNDTIPWGTAADYPFQSLTQAYSYLNGDTVLHPNSDPDSHMTNPGVHGGTIYIVSEYPINEDTVLEGKTASGYGVAMKRYSQPDSADIDNDLYVGLFTHATNTGAMFHVADGVTLTLQGLILDGHAAAITGAKPGMGYVIAPAVTAEKAAVELEHSANVIIGGTSESAITNVAATEAAKADSILTTAADPGTPVTITGTKDVEIAGRVYLATEQYIHVQGGESTPANTIDVRMDDPYEGRIIAHYDTAPDREQIHKYTIQPDILKTYYVGITGNDVVLKLRQDVYVADWGNDSRDVSTPDAPFKTFRRAYEYLGDTYNDQGEIDTEGSGGRIWIVGQVTVKDEITMEPNRFQQTDADGNTTGINVSGGDVSIYRYSKPTGSTYACQSYTGTLIDVTSGGDLTISDMTVSGSGKASPYHDAYGAAITIPAVTSVAPAFTVEGALTLENSTVTDHVNVTTEGDKAGTAALAAISGTGVLKIDGCDLSGDDGDLTVYHGGLRLVLDHEITMPEEPFVWLHGRKTQISIDSANFSIDEAVIKVDSEDIGYYHNRIIADYPDGITPDGDRFDVQNTALMAERNITKEVVDEYVILKAKVHVIYQLTNLTKPDGTCDTDIVNRGRVETGIIPADGYGLPDEITVKVTLVTFNEDTQEDESTDVTLEAGTDYTYDPATGEIVVNEDAVDGDVTIVATGVEKFTANYGEITLYAIDDPARLAEGQSQSAEIDLTKPEGGRAISLTRILNKEFTIEATTDATLMTSEEVAAEKATAGSNKANSTYAITATASDDGADMKTGDTDLPTVSFDADSQSATLTVALTNFNAITDTEEKTVEVKMTSPMGDEITFTVRIVPVVTQVRVTVPLVLTVKTGIDGGVADVPATYTLKNDTSTRVVLTSAAVTDQGVLTQAATAGEITAGLDKYMLTFAGDIADKSILSKGAYKPLTKVALSKMTFLTKHASGGIDTTKGVHFATVTYTVEIPAE